MINLPIWIFAIFVFCTSAFGLFIIYVLFALIYCLYWKIRDHFDMVRDNHDEIERLHKLVRDEHSYMVSFIENRFKQSKKVKK